jgi:hypothetical protein
MVPGFYHSWESFPDDNITKSPPSCLLGLLWPMFYTYIYDPFGNYTRFRTEVWINFFPIASWLAHHCLLKNPFLPP